LSEVLCLVRVLGLTFLFNRFLVKRLHFRTAALTKVGQLRRQRRFRLSSLRAARPITLRSFSDELQGWGERPS
jgi:hypothetical protein